MTYTEAGKRATKKYREKNIERTRELNLKHIGKWLETHREEYNKKALHKYHIKQEIKKIMLILIDENI